MQNQIGHKQIGHERPAREVIHWSQRHTWLKQARISKKQFGCLALVLLASLACQTRLLAAASNTPTGSQALKSITTGTNNTADGANALFSLTTGSNNTAVGFQAGYNLTNNANNNIDIGNVGVGGDNGIIRIGTAGIQTNAFIAGVINGNAGGLSNLNGAQLTGTIPLATLPSAVVTNNEPNVALGALTLKGTLNLPITSSSAGFINLSGSPLLHAYGAENFFGGLGAGNFTLSGSQNVGLGSFALGRNTSGSYNTASGDHALSSNAGGNNNTAIGASALQFNAGGGQNTANGAFAL